MEPEEKKKRDSGKHPIWITDDAHAKLLDRMAPGESKLMAASRIIAGPIITRDEITTKTEDRIEELEQQLVERNRELVALRKEHAELNETFEVTLRSRNEHRSKVRALETELEQARQILVKPPAPVSRKPVPKEPEPLESDPMSKPPFWANDKGSKDAKRAALRVQSKATVQAYNETVDHSPYEE